MSSYAFNQYALPLLVTGLAVLFLGVLTLAQERGSRVAGPFVLMSLTLAVWSFGMGTMYEEIDDGMSSDSDATFMFRFETGVDFHVIPELVIKIGAGYVVAAEDLHLLGLDVTPTYAPFVAGVEYRF